MIGALVVTMPSTYTGGELVVRHNGEQRACRGPKTELSLVAFYARLPARGRRGAVGVPDRAYLQPSAARGHLLAGG